MHITALTLNLQFVVQNRQLTKTSSEIKHHNSPVAPRRQLWTLHINISLYHITTKITPHWICCNNIKQNLLQKIVIATAPTPVYARGTYMPILYFVSIHK